MPSRCCRRLPMHRRKQVSKVLAPVAAKPDRTTANFGDWVLRCESVGSPAKRVCETAQGMTVQGQATPMAQVAIGATNSKAPRLITLAMPSNLAFAGEAAGRDDRTGCSAH